MTKATVTPIVGRQVVIAVATHAGATLPELVRSLAKQGYTALLREVLADGLIELARWAGDKHMAYAILPLARYACPDEQGAARALIQDWLVAFKGLDPADMATYFTFCPDVDTARELLAHGVDPLATIAWMKTTVREAVFEGNNLAGLVALLDVPGFATDESCIALMLAGFLKQMSPSEEKVWATFWQQAEQSGVLAASTAHLSAQLPRALAAASESLLDSGSFDDVYGRRSIKRWMQAMLWADLPPRQWEEMLGLGNDKCQLGSAMISDPDLAPFVVPVIARMAHSRTVVDALRVRCKGTTHPGTMLHAAMLDNNAPIVLALLEAGADPDATLHIHGKPKDAASVAPKSREAVQALAAWRARRAMCAVAQSGPARLGTGAP